MRRWPRRKCLTWSSFAQKTGPGHHRGTSWGLWSTSKTTTVGENLWADTSCLPYLSCGAHAEKCSRFPYGRHIVSVVCFVPVNRNVQGKIRACKHTGRSASWQVRTRHVSCRTAHSARQKYDRPGTYADICDRAHSRGRNSLLCFPGRGASFFLRASA